MCLCKLNMLWFGFCAGHHRVLQIHLARLSQFCGHLFDSGGNPKGVFGLAPVQGEWKVFVKRPLDREEQDRYLLNITASDGLFVTRIGVEVTVMDANDNSPICNQV